MVDNSAEITVEDAPGVLGTPVVKQSPCKRCGNAVVLRARGKIPTYCSQSCRQRDYELRRALSLEDREVAAGRIRPEPVEWVVEVERVVTKTLRPEAPVTGDGWLMMLNVLTAQLRAGQIRGQDLDSMVRGLNAAVAATNEQFASEAAARQQSEHDHQVHADIQKWLGEQLAAADDGTMTLNLNRIVNTFEREGRTVAEGDVRLALAALVEFDRVILERDTGTGVAHVDVLTIANHQKFRARTPRH